MSKYLLDHLDKSRTELAARARAILDTADAAKRELTQAEDTEFRSITKDLETINARSREIIAEDRQNEQIEANMRSMFGDDLSVLSTNQSRIGRQAAQRSLLPSMREYREAVSTRAVAGSGSAFVPAGQAGTFADRLRARSAIFGAGFQAVPVPNGTLRIPRITSSATVSALGENTAITPSDPGLGSSTLTLRKFAALTLASNEAFSDSNPSLRGVVGEDLVRQFATFADTQFLEGSGSGANVLGIRNMSGLTAGPSLGANGGTPTLDNYATMVTSLETANGSLADAVWIMHPRSWGTIRAIKDSQSRYQVNPGVTGAEQRSLFGAPVITSANLSITQTVGTSSDCSYVALVDRTQLVIGYGVNENDGRPTSFGSHTDDLGIELAFSEDYAFNADQVAVRVRGRFDIQPLNAAAIVLMTGVRP